MEMTKPTTTNAPLGVLDGWIRGKGRSGVWHLGRVHEVRGARTGEVLHRAHLTACSGAQLGGPWGYERATEPTTAYICKNCARIARRKTTNPP